MEREGQREQEGRYVKRIMRAVESQ